ncbi:MAG: Hsp20/alpha crystallin family protein [Desulfovibrionaceae bacterium]|nr:Hsp20/alpha crystallin family protein [Desulfovibrionaceae bacterium]MDD4951616.1 Hsp20/alpha crystallin family protein [Desulfovibrionaceae bacterium]
MVIDFSPFYDLALDWDKVFEKLHAPLPGGLGGYPPMNLSQDQDNVYAAFSVPGVKQQDLDITLTDKSLTVQGERKAPAGQYYRQERPMGRFQRVVNLNLPVDPEKVSARMVNGILEVVMPRSGAAKPRKISIETA